MCFPIENGRQSDQEVSVRVIYCNSASITSGGPIELWHLNSLWYVVGRGYLCQVDSEEAGLQVINELKAARTSAEPRAN